MTPSYDVINLYNFTISLVFFMIFKLCTIFIMSNSHKGGRYQNVLLSFWCPWLVPFLVSLSYIYIFIFISLSFSLIYIFIFIYLSRMLLVGLLFLFPVEMLDSIPNQLGLYSSIRVLHYPNIGLTDISRLYCYFEIWWSHHKRLVA